MFQEELGLRVSRSLLQLVRQVFGLAQSLLFGLGNYIYGRYCEVGPMGPLFLRRYGNLVLGRDERGQMCLPATGGRATTVFFLERREE